MFCKLQAVTTQFAARAMVGGCEAGFGLVKFRTQTFGDDQLGICAG